jgi:hypothetical protein
MGTPFLRAQHYHEQAAHLRKLAAAEENEENRKSLMEIAESYEKLSKRMFEQAKTAKP